MPIAHIELGAEAAANVVAVAERGTVSKVALRLGITQNALSRQIMDHSN
jgi:hypothetical protein